MKISKREIRLKLSSAKIQKSDMENNAKKSISWNFMTHINSTKNCANNKSLIQTTSSFLVPLNQKIKLNLKPEKSLLFPTIPNKFSYTTKNKCDKDLIKIEQKIMDSKIKTQNQISFNSTNTFIPHNDNNKNNFYSLKTFSNFNNRTSIKLIKKNQSKPIFPGIDLYKIKSQTKQNLKKEVLKSDNKNISNSKNIIKYLRFKNNLVSKLIKSSSSLLKKDMIKKFRKEKKFISASNVDFLAFDKYIEKIEKNSEIFVHKKKRRNECKKIFEK